MASAFRWAAAVVVLSATLAPAQGTAKYSVKSVKAEPPTQLAAPVRKLLGDQAVQFRGPKGDVLAELWFRKEVPSDPAASAEQVKQGPTYHEVEQTTILGAVRFARPWTDYRKQKIKAGVYTIRLGFQPMDGDHMGTAPYPDFGLLVAAAEDKSPGTMDPKKLYEVSAGSIGTSHPAVLLLYPNARPGATPQVGSQPGNQVTVNTRTTLRAKGGRGVLGISLTLVGHAE
jgi:hypothetical protein